MHQRDWMSRLWVEHQGDEDAVVRLYAESERAGIVSRTSNLNNTPPETYAQALLRNGMGPGDKERWLPDLSPTHLRESRAKDLTAILRGLNQLSVAYSIGDLQLLRMRVKGLKSRKTRTPFPSKPNNDDWAFHTGGRTELQFNVGRDHDDGGAARLRHGVAFSFEPGQDVPDPVGTLRPAVAHFNDYVRAHPDELSDMRMWIWKPDGSRSSSRPLGSIQPDEVKFKTFVFLGKLGPTEPTLVDLHQMLADLDRLLPVYEYVLRATEANLAPSPPDSPLPSPGGTTMLQGKRSTKVVRRAGESGVSLRHRQIQEELHRIMVERYGASRVRHEHPTASGGRIDLRVEPEQDAVVYYEIKTAGSAAACVREALGQLLEYAQWPGAEDVDRLVVVGEHPATLDTTRYLAALQDQYGLPLSYLHFAMPVGDEVA